MKLSILVVIAYASLVSFAQAPVREHFEAATLKAEAPVPLGATYSANLGVVRNGKVTLKNVTLSDCLKFAYGIVSDDQIFGPDWIKSRDVRFEIVGQASPNTADDRALLMLQTLIAERLRVSLHREQRELPSLALVIAKNGPKLRPPKEDMPTFLGLGRIVHPRMPMSVLATLLSRFERQIVMNLTGLEGAFEINLQWTPENIRRLSPPGGTPISVNGETIDSNGPSLYTAIQEQLGLRLESRKGPVDVVVVDQAEKIPTEN